MSNINSCKYDAIILDEIKPSVNFSKNIEWLYLKFGSNVKENINWTSLVLNHYSLTKIIFSQNDFNQTIIWPITGFSTKANYIYIPNVNCSYS